DLVKLLHSEDLSEFPAALTQGAHARLTTLLAKESGRLRRMKCRALAKASSTFCTPIERRQPTSQPYGPKSKIRQRQLPRSATLDFPCGKQKQPEHRLCNFLFRQNALDDFTDHRQAGAETVVALRFV